MPHFFVEYSANIEPEIHLDALMERLYAAAVESGVFEPGGIRIRGVRRDRYRIADNHPDNGFVHVVGRIAHGRDQATRKRVGEALFQAVCDQLQPLFARRPLAISLELQELDPHLSFRKNNLHEYVKTRAARPAERPRAR